MRPPAVHPWRSRRGRASTAIVAGAAVLATVVAVNQHPSASPVPPKVAAVAAASTTQRSAATPSATQEQHSGMQVLHARFHFTDEPLQHSGVPALSTASGILIDPDSGTILWEKDPHVARPLASTTKILTAIVALENLSPDQTVAVTPDALNQAADETRLGMAAGDHYTVTELLTAMLLISANDAASALAVDTVGLTRFVEAMNEQVTALGLRDSRFTNPVGLDDPGELSSPYDLAVLGLAAYQNLPLFRRIVGTHDIDVPPTSGHIAYHLHNINRLLEIYPPALGIKPGYTGDAGYCLVMLAQRSGQQLVGVLMDDPHLATDARALLEWGFRQEGLPPLATPTPSPSPSPTPKPRR